MLVLVILCNKIPTFIQFNRMAWFSTARCTHSWSKRIAKLTINMKLPFQLKCLGSSMVCVLVYVLNISLQPVARSNSNTKSSVFPSNSHQICELRQCVCVREIVKAHMCCVSWMEIESCDDCQGMDRWTSYTTIHLVINVVANATFSLCIPVSCTHSSTTLFYTPFAPYSSSLYILKMICSQHNVRAFSMLILLGFMCVGMYRTDLIHNTTIPHQFYCF